jgi:hypothetical protein
VALPADLQARGEALAAPVLAALEGMTTRMPAEATVGGRAQEWYGVLRDSKKVPRFASYRRNLEVFPDQVGRSSPLESIDSRTLEGWHGKLLFGCSRKFLKWLAGHKLIELPSNFDDTDFRFEAGNRVTADRLFTSQEVPTILEAASPRMRLFLLLMLNCGFYPSDVSDLTGRRSYSFVAVNLGVILSGKANEVLQFLFATPRHLVKNLHRQRPRRS